MSYVSFDGPINYYQLDLEIIWSYYLGSPATFVSFIDEDEFIVHGKDGRKKKQKISAAQYESTVKKNREFAEAETSRIYYLEPAYYKPEGKADAVVKGADDFCARVIVANAAIVEGLAKEMFRPISPGWMAEECVILKPASCYSKRWKVDDDGNYSMQVDRSITFESCGMTNLSSAAQVVGLAKALATVAVKTGLIPVDRKLAIRLKPSKKGENPEAQIAIFRPECEKPSKPLQSWG